MYTLVSARWAEEEHSCFGNVVHVQHLTYENFRGVKEHMHWLCGLVHGQFVSGDLLRSGKRSPVARGTVPESPHGGGI